LPIKCQRSNYLPKCIVLQMSIVPNFNIEAGWRYQSEDWQWPKWEPQRVQLIVWHRRSWLGSPTVGPASRPRVPGQVIRNYKGSTATETEPCRYCHCIPSSSKFSKLSWGNSTTSTRTPDTKLSSTNYPSPMVHYPPRCCRYATLVETRMFHNPRPVQIRMFPNTKMLLLR